MSAPIDSASQGSAADVCSVAGASAEVEVEGGLSSNGGMTPPAAFQEAIQEAIGADAASTPSAGSSVSSRAPKHRTNPVIHIT